jgi:hypothetical protein
VWSASRALMFTQSSTVPQVPEATECVSSKQLRLTSTPISLGASRSKTPEKLLTSDRSSGSLGLPPHDVYATDVSKIYLIAGVIPDSIWEQLNERVMLASLKDTDTRARFASLFVQCPISFPRPIALFPKRIVFLFLSPPSFCSASYQVSHACCRTRGQTGFGI